MGVWKSTMEKLALNDSFWKNKSVLVTGHTGFKGGWLVMWLHSLGARIHGYALPPLSSPNLFVESNIESILESNTLADIRDEKTFEASIKSSKPDIIFHLAAQPLVRQSYIDPKETYSTNVMGTINLFEAVRKVSSVKALINITTDKCYENNETQNSFVETDPMGGHDPYAASKGCSELITASYRKSFFEEKGIAIASVRAGNVIGGGDWSIDRLIPDFFRAIDKKKDLVIRSPNAIRPWQHVLEPLMGYLQLAEKLIKTEKFSQAWNFGPPNNDAKSVEYIVNKLTKSFPHIGWSIDPSPQPHEAHYLTLDSSKSKNELGWKPKWNLDSALENIISWHQAWSAGQNMQKFSLTQIRDYQNETTNK